MADIDNEKRGYLIGEFVYFHEETQGTYLQIPIYAFRGLLLNPKKCFSDITFIMATDCNSADDFADRYDRETTDNWLNRAKEKGEKLLKYMMQRQDIRFQTPMETFWKFHNIAGGYIRKKDYYDMWLWLCFMALHTIGGRSKMRFATDEMVFIRAAGYMGKRDYLDDVRNNRFGQGEDAEEVKRYHLPTTSSDPTEIEKSHNRLKMAGRKMRENLMLRYTNFVAYSQSGRRGWWYTFSKADRCTTLSELRDYVMQVVPANRDARAALKLQMQRAREGAKSLNR